MKQLIPELIAEEYIRSGTEGEFRTFALFIDISGFTSMTERLLNEGKQGAEILSAIINSVFTPLIDAVYESGGFVVSFAGDAFTALFPTEIVPATAVVEAASRMQVLFRDTPVQKTPWQDFPLKARVGVGEGEVGWRIFRFEESAAYLFSGPAVEESAAAEHLCSPGMIVVPARREFADLALKEAQATADKNYLQIAPQEISSSQGKPRMPAAPPDAEILQRFLPFDRLPSSASGEFRTITSIFIAYDEERIQAAELFEAVVRSGRDKGAYLNLIDSGDKGGVQLVLFGAPFSVEKRTRRALEFAFELVDSLPGLRIGAADGQAFTGYVGSERRSTYTALGSVVNLSARLALAAPPGTVLAERGLLRGIEGFALSEEKRGRFKGIDREISYGMASRTKASADPAESPSGPGIGRTEELDKLRRWSAEVFRRSVPEAMLIAGEAGIGKSQLIEELLKGAEPAVPVETLTFNSLFQRGFGPLRELFSRRFSGMESAEAENLISGLISPELPDYLKNELKRAAPALLDLAGRGTAESDYGSLDVEARYERTLEALVAYFEARYLRSAGLLILDQAQAMDTGTRDFVKRLIARNDAMPLCVIYLSRNAQGEDFPGVDEERTIHLTPFSDREIQEAAERELTARADEQLIELVRKRSAGIPLHVFALFRYLRERGLIRIGAGQAHLSGESADALPATINDLTISQYDALPTEAREILPFLAAAGNSLPDKLLSAAEIDPGGPGIAALLKAQILERKDSANLVFRKEFMREAVYELQLSDALKSLNHRLFGAWRRAFPEKESYCLEKGYHAEQSGSIPEAREYYLLAAGQAQDNFSNPEAIDLYHRVIRLDPQNDENTSVRLSIAEIHDLVGEWDEAYEELVRGVGFATLADREEELHRFFALGGQVLLQQSRIPQAKHLLLKAVRDPRSRGINQARIKARIDLARVHLLEGAYTDAMNRLFEARDMAQESAYTEGEGLATYYLGRLYSVRNRRKEAAAFYTESQKLFSVLKRPRLMANPLYDLGLLRRNEGKLEAAREYLEEALNLYVQIGYKSGISAALLNIGLIHDQQGEFVQAEEYFSRSLNIAREIGEDLAVAFARFCLGAAAYKEGNLEKSLDYLSDAHRMIDELGAETYRGYTLSYLSSLLVRLGRPLEAAGYIRSLYELIRSTGEDPEHGRLYLALGALVRDGMPGGEEISSVVTAIALAEKIDPPDSIHFYRQAVKVANDAHYVNTLIPALIRLGEQLIKHDRRESGMKYIRKAQTLAAGSGWRGLSERLQEQYGPGE